MTRKIVFFFEEWSWFKFNNMGLALGTNFNFYIGVAKGLKLKFRKFFGLIPTFPEVTEENLVGGRLKKNRVKVAVSSRLYFYSLIPFNLY